MAERFFGFTTPKEKKKKTFKERPCMENFSVNGKMFLTVVVMKTLWQLFQHLRGIE